MKPAERNYPMTRLGIIGSGGRMGRAIAQAITDAGHELAGGVDRDEDVSPLAAASDVLIDFSSPAALEGNLDAAVAAGVPILVGTTGLEERHHWLLDQAADKIPVLQTGNTSLGVMLAFLVEEAAKRLGEDWDIEIVETHHRMKVDAPPAPPSCWAKRRRGDAKWACRTSPYAGAMASPARANPAPSVSQLCAGAAWRGITRSTSSPITNVCRSAILPKIAASLHAGRSRARSGSWAACGRYGMREVLGL
jgi:4-hydroxy-tetrahydrodipicolinate reductase